MNDTIYDVKFSLSELLLIDDALAELSKNHSEGDKHYATIRDLRHWIMLTVEEK